jgi:hypothetical protein
MKIGKLPAQTLSALIRRDLAAVTRLTSKLALLSNQLGDENAKNSAAYHLHNIYNALENSFLEISRNFENHITQPEQWHRELLEKMYLEISSVRPAVLKGSLRGVLRDMLGFRHFFRHAYDFEIDAGKLGKLMDDWRQSAPELMEAMKAFCEMLERHAEQGGE